MLMVTKLFFGRVAWPLKKETEVLQHVIVAQDKIMNPQPWADIN